MRYKNLAKEKNKGIVYTPTVMAHYIADEIISHYPMDKTGQVIKILDPALGEGELALAVITAIKASYTGNKISLYGYDIDPLAVEKSKKRIREIFPDVEINFVVKDFLNEETPPADIDIVIANPPYIRTQILGENTSKRLSEKFGLKGKVDIYYAFFVLSLETLKNGGVAGFITSNKFLTINSGKSLRSCLYKNAQILTISDFGDTRIFNAAVLPCVTVFKKTDKTLNETYRAKFNSIYLSDSSSNDNQFISVDSVYDCIGRDGSFIDKNSVCYKAKTGYTVLSAESFHEPWVITTSSQEKWLDKVEANTWHTFKDVSKVRVGIKTTADNVFLFDRDLSTVDLELMKPLITHRNAQCYLPNNSKPWSVLYPHYEKNGKRLTYDLEQFPKAKSYLLKHFEQLDGRKYVKKANRAWYEIWVPQKPSLWSHRKIVFRDISEYPEFWFVTEDAVINGDCYWIEFPEDTDDDIIYLMLAVANSRFIIDFYDKKFNTKLYSSKRRFMSQYVEQFPIPDKNRDESRQIIRLVKTLLDSHTLDWEIKKQIDLQVESVFS
ncbi:MAG: N-6 DNA methylase [Proteobacteria bacterium]|uniref:site-specific DNA-methyltransferase (adenine-specific) n=1 Tax=Candidatus Avisuccinivibrio stercorigallinarum TaxID=2840704 RepID=A0A9D9DCB5_9GAMM|nr:N-6 DNA methylase [Candidatus Avisuccinivibrio stercorigallinarum]